MELSEDKRAPDRVMSLHSERGLLPDPGSDAPNRQERTSILLRDSCAARVCLLVRSRRCFCADTTLCVRHFRTNLDTWVGNAIGESCLDSSLSVCPQQTAAFRRFLTVVSRASTIPSCSGLPKRSARRTRRCDRRWSSVRPSQTSRACRTSTSPVGSSFNKVQPDQQVKKGVQLTSVGVQRSGSSSIERASICVNRR